MRRRGGTRKTTWRACTPLADPSTGHVHYDMLLKPRLNALSLIAVLGCATNHPPAARDQTTVARALQTVPESTSYRETSRHADVVSFLAQLETASRELGTL